MSNNKTVIGLTIGPIYKTLGGARKTIELWAASYTFSYLMKRIVAGVLADKSLQVKLLQPFADANLGSGDSAGLFPDRMMLESEAESDFQALVDIVNAEKKRFAASIAACFKDTANPAAVEASIVAYFQAYLVQIPYPEKIEGADDDTGLLDAVNDYLETAELQQVFKPIDPESEDYLNQFFQLIKTKSNRGLIAKVFEGVGSVSIQSLEEIALNELKLAYPILWKELTNENDDELIDAAKEKFKGLMKKRHRYVAIIQADGDNVGKTVGALDSPEEYQDYCQRLSAFQLEAVQKIREFGGLPIYAGGDDLLFFAPVSVDDQQHVFQLAETLNDIFSAKLKPLIDAKNAALPEGKEKIKPPTLSFGVSISYYKFPLYEALEVSRKLLFADAKSKEGKNAIAVRVLLHSGHYFGGVYSMRKEADGGCIDKAYGHLLKMIEIAGNADNLRLNSVTYALSRNQALLYAMNGDQWQVLEFFENTFNEDIHENVSLQPFWRSAQNLVAEAYQTTAYKNARTAADAATMPRQKDQLQQEANGIALDQAYSVLRFIHFLNQADDAE